MYFECVYIPLHFSVKIELLLFPPLNIDIFLFIITQEDTLNNQNIQN